MPNLDNSQLCNVTLSRVNVNISSFKLEALKTIPSNSAQVDSALVCVTRCTSAVGIWGRGGGGGGHVHEMMTILWQMSH